MRGGDSGQTVVKPDLDRWLAGPALRVTHRRESTASADALWEAARSVRLSDTAMLGRLIRWRIPGVGRNDYFDDLFRQPPFIVLDDDDERVLISGLVGRIWTLRRDYRRLHTPDEFRQWSQRGTVRVVFANWVEPAAAGGRSALASEARVEPLGLQGRRGGAAVGARVSAPGRHRGDRYRGTAGRARRLTGRARGSKNVPARTQIRSRYARSQDESWSRYRALGVDRARAGRAHRMPRVRVAARSSRPGGEGGDRPRACAATSRSVTAGTPAGRFVQGRDRQLRHHRRPADAARRRQAGYRDDLHAQPRRHSHGAEPARRRFVRDLGQAATGYEHV